MHKPFVETPSSIWTLHLSVEPLFSSGNRCNCKLIISKCVPLCRPTWVHSVIPRKGVVVMVVMVVMMMLMVVVVIGGDGDGW